MRKKLKYQINERYVMKKNKDELLQKQNGKNKSFEELLRSYVEIENRLKALEENASINDSENNKKFQ